MLNKILNLFNKKKDRRIKYIKVILIKITLKIKFLINNINKILKYKKN